MPATARLAAPTHRSRTAFATDTLVANAREVVDGPRGLVDTHIVLWAAGPRRW